MFDSTPPSEHRTSAWPRGKETFVRHNGHRDAIQDNSLVAERWSEVLPEKPVDIVDDDASGQRRLTGIPRSLLTIVTWWSASGSDGQKSQLLSALRIPVRGSRLTAWLRSGKRSGSRKKISRSILERHGGRLWAEPNPVLGATFRFELPAVEGA
ncbi:hypothetical protein WMF46_41215 [Sorangium sp. So ce117]